MRRLLEILARLKLYQIFLVSVFSAVLLAALIAPQIYRFIEGEINTGIHVATILSTFLVTTPLIYLYILNIVRLLEHEERIKKANANTRWKNQVFRSLLELSVSMHQTEELPALIDKILATLKDLYSDCEFAVMIHGNRPGMIRYFATTSLTDKEKSYLVDHAAQLAQKEFDTVVEVLEQITPGNQTNGKNFVQPPTWTILPMHGRGQNLIGTLVIKAADIDTYAKEIMTLFLEQISVATENKLLAIELEKLANTDALTGAYNRTFFEKELRRYVQAAYRNPDIYFSILVIDINGLKEINDKFGHAAGDQLIIIVSRLLMGIIREADLLTRFGGDEFVILCPNTNSHQVHLIEQQIRDKEKSAEVIIQSEDSDTIKIPVRMSIGTACSTDSPADQVISRADASMFEDKEAFYNQRSRYR
ncbi:MAG TPA: hypothetical protein DCZ03_14330 [Gammaproteobacteria bacterium]|nr:hypothetical protein [Gammaproteobacteria bacterium]